MPSLISGFEYDIFISYRHKDNKGAHWVSKFLNALKTELDATFKEDISIYFDENPRDGLLETHNVDKSVEGKLKCLIFIPIISQTYCDPKSFAWQNELCAFNKMAKEDQFGRDIKLRNGNVASRILPVRIHDLDSQDLKILYEELGGSLRSIDFVYKEAGVNRPLRSDEERPSKNQNHTLYRNQINKVANNIKEIIESITNPNSLDPEKIKSKIYRSGNPRRRNSIIALIVFFILTIASYLFYSKLYQVGNEGEAFEKSIAVLPFVDMTPSGDMEYLGDGIAEEIINSLTAIKELKVIGRTSSFQFKGDKKLDLREVGERLHVGIVLEGSIQKYEDHFRIIAQLVNTKNNVHIWAERYDLQQTNIFKIQDNIAANIVDRLQLTLSSIEKKRIVKKEINPDAYTLFLKGLYQYKASKFEECIEYEQKAIQLDSTYAPAFAYVGLAKSWIIYNAHRWQDSLAVKDAQFFSQRAIELDPELAEGYSSIGLISWSLQYDFAKARIYFEKSIERNPASSLILNRYCYFLVWMGDFEKASQLAMDAMRLDPVDYNSYVILFYVHIYSGRLAEAADYLKEWKRIFGNGWLAASLEMRLSFDQGLYENVVQQCDSIRASGESLGAGELSLLARALLKLNRVKDSDIILKQLKTNIKPGDRNASFNTALVYATRHEIDSCFTHLTRASKNRDEGFKTLKIEPAFQELRKDPRYIKLYQDNGFDKY